MKIVRILNLGKILKETCVREINKKKIENNNKEKTTRNIHNI